MAGKNINNMMSIIKANGACIDSTPIQPTIDNIEAGLEIVLFDGLKVMREIINNTSYNNKVVDVRDKIGAITAAVSLGRYIEARKNREDKAVKKLDIDDKELIIGE